MNSRDVEIIAITTHPSWTGSDEHKALVLDWLQNSENDAECNPSILMRIIESGIEDKIIKCQAYLNLLRFGSLGLLKRLAEHMDFSFSDKWGNALYHVSVADRADLIMWLYDDHAELFNLSESEKAKLILNTVYSGAMTILYILCGPDHVEWDINVNYLGVTPVSMAIKAMDIDMLRFLTLSKAQGGFELPLTDAALFMLTEHSKFTHHPSIGFTYIRQALPHNKSFFELQYEDESSEVFEFTKTLGNGRFNNARLFTSRTNPNHRVTVKSPLRSINRYDIFSVEDELLYTQRSYPKEQKFFAAHYVDEEGNQDYRMVLPYRDGDGLLDAAVKCETYLEFACMVLAVAKEIQRIHILGFVHCDCKFDNMIIKKVPGALAPHFNVYLIDLNLMTPIGEKLKFEHPASFLAPEYYGLFSVPAAPAIDVFALAKSLLMAMGAFIEQLEKKVEDKMLPVPQFMMSIRHFVASGLKSDPNKRQSLTFLIENLSQDLEQYTYEENARCSLHPRN